MNPDEQFERDLYDLIQAQETMKTIASKAKEARDPIKETVEQLEERVKTYMASHNAFEVEFDEQVISYKEITRGLGLSRKSLKAALLDYFNDDDAAATECFESLLEHIGTKQVTVLARRAIKVGAAERAKDGAKLPPTYIADDEDPPALGNESP